MQTALVRSTLPLVTAVLLGAHAAAQEVMYTLQGPNLLTIDPTTGAQVGSTPITNGQSLFAGLTREGGQLYTIDGVPDGASDFTFRFDSTSGAGTVVGPTGQDWNMRGVEIHPLNGGLYAVNDDTLWLLDKTTGSATLIGSLSHPNLDQFTAFAINSQGVAYGVDYLQHTLYTIDLTSGVLTSLGNLNIPSNVPVQDLGFDSLDRLWALMFGVDGVYRIDIATLTPTFQFSSLGWYGIAFSGCPAPANYCTAGTTSGGCVPTLSTSGFPTVGATSGFTIACNNVDANRTGLFFYGLTDTSFSPVPWGASTSFLCVKSPTQRMGTLNSGGTTGCTGSFAQDWSAYIASHPGALGTPLSAGQRFDAQLWMRDPPSPKTTMLSDGVRFTICP